ncbi:hypothetical protein BDV12DRAFT_207459 [Aspergillus spectabilis]
MHLPILSSVLLLAATTAGAAAVSPSCKSSPQDPTWPGLEEWNALNSSIDGTLLRTAPAASSCYPGNPSAQLKTGMDYSIFTNHSRLPLVLWEQIATAMKWASERNIRIVIKGTGHDMSGRSTGANSLSIWTHNLNHFKHEPKWQLPGGNGTANVAILGSGNNWGSAYTAVHTVNRTIVGGADATVGLGGLIQNGGHGLMSSTHGLASDNLYQGSVITTDGGRLVANDEQNQQLFWAVRGAGGGQFGVVTEMSSMVGGLSFYATGKSNASDVAWDALAETASLIPDLMDSGITGTLMAESPTIAGAGAIISLTSFNSTIARMNATVNELASRISKAGHGHMTIVAQAPSTNSYWNSTKPNQLASQSSGASSLITSRLLGKRELSEIERDDLHLYLQQILLSADGGSMALFGLQGGPGTANTPEERRGSTHPAWRTAYAHFMTYGAPVNATADVSEALATGVEWYEANIEPVWRNWVPGGGSYANEGNIFNSNWKEDFYGENYDRLVEVKREYDPTESLFVWGGVESDLWDYDLHSGLLCRMAVV